MARAEMEYQLIVTQLLLQVSQEPDAKAGPYTVVTRLKQFWESGETGWEDCFNEPLYPLA